MFEFSVTTSTNCIREFIEFPEVETTSIDVDVCHPFSVTPRFGDAANAGCIAFIHAFVEHIFGSRDRSKIGYSVVISNPIDVIDLEFWPRTRVDSPNHPVRFKHAPLIPALQVTVPTVYVERWLSRYLRPPNFILGLGVKKVRGDDEPSHFPGVKVAVKALRDLVKNSVSFSRHVSTFKHDPNHIHGHVKKQGAY